MKTCFLRERSHKVLPGQYFDKETNLHYNYLRNYDPAIGRYVQSDPVGIVPAIGSLGRADSKALRLANSDFEKGSLRVVSYARPGKLFTANQQLLVSEVGILNAKAFSRLLDAVVGVLRPAGK